MAVSFDVTRDEFVLISRIASRAVGVASQAGEPTDKIQFQMDITAAHANGCPLRLVSLLEADDFNFAHDVFGIRRHLNRDTGEIENCFLPRFAQPEA